MRQTGPVRTGSVTSSAGWTVALSVGLVVLLVGAALAARVLGGRIAGGVSPSSWPPAVPAQGAGSGTVELSADAARHPAAADVRAQLQRYFDAVNARDYASWTATVVQQRVDEQPRTQWLAGVDSTTDGTIRIDRIDRIADLDDGRVLALVRFVSTQDLADAPAGLRAARICWRAALPLTGIPPKLESSSAGSVLAEAC